MGSISAGDDILYFTENDETSGAPTFGIDAEGHLLSNDGTLNVGIESAQLPLGASNEYLVFNSEDPSSNVESTCSITDDNKLLCENADNVIFYVCPADQPQAVKVGPFEGTPDDCQELTLLVIQGD